MATITDAHRVLFAWLAENQQSPLSDAATALNLDLGAVQNLISDLRRLSERHKVSDQVETEVREVETRRDKLVDLAAEMMKAYGSALYPLDFLFVAALNRTSSQVLGFTTMIRAQNYLCAAPMVRLQLDTALRVFAGTLVDDPHKFAIDVLGGAQVRRLKAADGNRMRDDYLVTKLGELFPWVPHVYEKASGFIHFSNEHYFSSIVGVEDGTRIVSVKISPVDEGIPDEKYCDMVRAFHAALVILSELTQSWLFTKSNPEASAKLRVRSQLKTENP